MKIIMKRWRKMIYCGDAAEEAAYKETKRKSLFFNVIKISN